MRKTPLSEFADGMRNNYRDSATSLCFRQVIRCRGQETVGSVSPMLRERA